MLSQCAAYTPIEKRKFPDCYVGQVLQKKFLGKIEKCKFIGSNLKFILSSNANPIISGKYKGKSFAQNPSFLGLFKGGDNVFEGTGATTGLKFIVLKGIIGGANVSLKILSLPGNSED